MKWLNEIVDDVEKRHPDGEIVVSSGVTPSGKYHLGTLREVLTAEAINRELKRRNRKSRHLHIADDLDVFRKVPAGAPETYKSYLGKPLVDIPAPDNSKSSYADYFLTDLKVAKKELKLDMEIIRASDKYRTGFFESAIEKALAHAEDIKKILQDVSGRKLGDDYSPIQVIEGGYLKTRKFIDIDNGNKTITYLDPESNKQSVNYANGDVKLNWRIDWPARWLLLDVDVEPFGRDHATKGGSYDTGAALSRKVFNHEPPLPVPYEFINRSGDTKKMSKSAGNTITISELLDVLPPEIVWFFIVRYSPNKLLFFDTGDTLIHLFDEFAELQAKVDKTEQEIYLLNFCLKDVEKPTVSNIPFSHLVSSYQAARHDTDKTLKIIHRTEHSKMVDHQETIIRHELAFIATWLKKYAPKEVKFNIEEHPDYFSDFNDAQRNFLHELAAKIEKAPKNADGIWFHQTIYDLKDSSGLEPKELFATIYRVLINKDYGPRAGYFLSILDSDWLVKRLRFEI